MLHRLITLLAILVPVAVGAQTGASEVLTFRAIADTYVDGGTPTAKFGGGGVLKADASPIRIIYLRFAVSGVRGRQVEHARLRLGVADVSRQTGGTVHRITNTPWDEGTLTYASRPPVDGPGLDTLGPVTTIGALVEFGLDGAVPGDGVYELAIDSTSTSGVGYYSINSATGPAPTLVLTVANTAAPTVVIGQPPAGSTFFVGDALTFTATASDPTDGDLGAAIAWRSDLDGPLGAGASITTPLHEGHHVVTAQVANRAGTSATAQVDVTVVQRPSVNTEPLVAITAPVDGQTLVAGQPIRFAGSAHDLEEGDLTGALAWTSDRDGVLGTGGAFSRALSLGTHQIAARVADSAGLAGAARVTLAIVPPDTLTLVPVADAFVDSGTATTNAGTNALLRVDASPTRIAYLRFLVQDLAGQRVAGARLRLQVDTGSGAGSPSGGTLRALTNHTWQETTLTYATRPPLDGPVLATVGPVVPGQLVDLDLGTAIAGDGPFDVALMSDSSDVADYRARESTTPPK